MDCGINRPDLFVTWRMKELEQNTMEDNVTTVEIPEGNNVEKKLVRRRRRKYLSSYVLNFITMVILVLIVFSFDFGIIAGNKTGFYCKDPLLSHKYTGDTVHAGAMYLTHFIIPPILFYIVESQGGYKRRSLRDVSFVWNWYFDLMIGLFLTLVMTQTCKAVIASPRPHFFDSCRPDANENCTFGTFITNYKCTNQDSSKTFILETVRSFPSGHASLSTLAAIYCATYINVRLTNKHLGKVVKPLMATLFISWGLVVPLTRISDHRHHWWDVLVGCLLGILGAHVTIRYLSQNFKSPSSRKEQTSVESDTTLLR